MKADNRKPLRVCLINFPYASMSSSVLLLNQLQLLEPICDKLYAITGNVPKEGVFTSKVQLKDTKVAMHFKESVHPLWWSILLWILKNILFQIRACLELLKISRNIDIVICYLGIYYLPPMLTAKLLGKKVLKIAVLPESEAAKILYGRRSVSQRIISLLDRINHSIADYIIVDLENVSQLGLVKYEGKIVPRPRQVDLHLFESRKPLNERRNLVGFIGRLSKVKGILNFVDAMPMVLEGYPDVEFLVGGGGTLAHEVEEKIKSYHSDRITFTGWIPHELLPDYLNEMKLLVVPSVSDTGPFVAIEAMACGTPVLGSRVGLMAHIIEDGKTGFILENNSPECIAANIRRALENQELDEIAMRARRLVEEKYSHEAAVEQYQKSLSRLK
ncbi:MAG: glycosyltransferase family 4 protein [Dehalococcoidales bacterium]|nr:glycosyltransferase family 4 protein [Dehalococcoidales bacterium]